MTNKNITTVSNNGIKKVAIEGTIYIKLDPEYWENSDYQSLPELINDYSELLEWPDEYHQNYDFMIVYETDKKKTRLPTLEDVEKLYLPFGIEDIIQYKTVDEI